MRKFPIGMIGYGYWGRILYRYLRKHEGLDVRRIASRHPEKLKEEIHDDLNLCSPDELLEDDNLEAVIVATPIGTHYKYIMKALEKGKHIFSEKPMTLKGKEARDIAELADEKGLKVFTDYIFTYSPAVLKMISLAKAGAVGNVTSAVFHVRQLGHFSPNSVFIDLGCHILGVLDMLTPIDRLKFTRLDLLSHDGVVETGILDFEPGEKTGELKEGVDMIPGKPVNYINDLRGGIFLSFNHPVKVRNMTIYGDKGTLVYDMMQEKPLQLLNYRVNRGESRDPRDKNIVYFDFDEFNTVEKVVEGFYRILTGEEPSNLEMSVRVTEVLDRLF